MADKANKQRANLRRWITITHQSLASNVPPNSNHSPDISLESTDKIGAELMIIDESYPDDRVKEYVDKLREIKRFLNEQQDEKEQKEIDALRRRTERLRLENELSNQSAEQDAKQELLSLQLQTERLRQEKEAALIEQAKAKTAAANTPKASPINAIRLDLKISPFDGSPSKYRRFEESFEALVESNPSYSDAAKFLYFTELIGKYSDQYAPNLSPTLANLRVVKQRLRERFEDPGRVREHVRATFERLPIMRHLSQTNLLHQLIVAWEEGVMSLQKTGTSDDQINNTYVPLMTRHLPASLIDKIDCNRNWTTERLIDALKVVHKRQQEISELSSEFAVAPSKETRTRAHIHAARPESPKASSHRPQYIVSPPVSAPLTVECEICAGGHRSIYCNSYTVQRRREIVAQKKLCTRCLSDGHDHLDCRSQYVCRCGQHHSRVLCARQPSLRTNSRPSSPIINAMELEKDDDNVSIDSSQETYPKELIHSEEEEEIFTATTTAVNNNSHAITKNAPHLKYARPDKLVSYYKTVVVRVNGQKVRVLLDGGGGRSAISEHCANRLNLPLYAEQDLGIGGLGGPGKLSSKRLVSADLCSIVSAHKLSVVLSVLPSLNGFKPAAIPERFWEELRSNGYVLTDTPDFHHEPIEIILGLEYIGYIWMSLEQMATDDICIRQSIFGWTAFGVTTCHFGKRKASTSNSLLMIMSSYYEHLPKEEDSPSELTVDEQQYLEQFISRKVQLVNNRFVVQLPWLEPTSLGTNKRQAYERFRRLVKGLNVKARFAEYSSAMKEMITKFAEPVPSDLPSGKIYYLPHHCVIRMDKLTTQLRIVYDGSAAEPGFQSLNDSLFKGVNSWNSLDLLLQFRYGRHTLIADIEKAFLQILVDSPDRDALRFWWLSDDGKPVEYRFRSVPFGTSASPFLLYACMHKLFQQMMDKEELSPISEVARLIKDRFYVDDLIIALQIATPHQIATIKEATIDMFSRAGMNVCKWRTNLVDLDAKWSPGSPDRVKLLGHQYHTTTDTLSLQVDLPLAHNLSVISKRLFSSLLARLYDPLGFISPYIILLRLLLRKVWQQGLDWDDPLPDDLREEALIAFRDSQLVNTIEMNRNVLPPDGTTSKLFVYSDASKQAIGAVAYSLVDSKTSLVHSKSRLVRLSPAKEKKEDTIVTLELEGIVLAAELAHHLNRLQVYHLKPESMKVRGAKPFASVVICSDSLINLQRLVKHPNSQRSSISLRVNRIAKLVPGAEFRHVDTKSNPADLISRGSSLGDLINNPLWFNPVPPSEDTRFSEEIRTCIAAISPVQLSCPCSRFATYGQALNCWRRIAHAFRRALKERPSSLPDIALGKIMLIKYLQNQHFASEIDALGREQQFDRNSVLRGRKCFIDDDGILRLQTRLLAGENLTLDQVKPIILPSKCHLVELLVQFEHQRLGHPGIERTMLAIRDQFYALGARKSVHRLISRCMMCKRLRGQPNKVDFGFVPKFRYDFESTPFTNVGIDIYGPLKTAMTTPGKRYGVIFSCATTRAVHLEPIHDQTQESVFQAMLNFMARRGIPHKIYTDNGKNLMAVKKQLVRFLNQLSTTQPGLSLHVEWIQLTVASPWRGGFYERLIRIIKDTLMALTFGKKVTNDELATTLYQIEARLNSRPLFVYEGQMVTPSHFFAKRPLMQIPPIGSKVYADIARPKLIQWYKAMQSHVNAVWHAWYSQYLLQLRSFHQNLFEPNQADSLREGDAVILKNPTPSDTWPFGVVEKVIKSEDGVIRTVFVRTHDRGQLTVKARDIRTLIPFECTREIHEEADAPEPPKPPASADNSC